MLSVAARTTQARRAGVEQRGLRIDAVPKVTGSFAYGGDLWADGMLWGHTLRSPHAHARIGGIDISGAVTVPGVHAVLLAGDVPGQRTFGIDFADQPVLADGVVRHVGEPVAVVAADDPELARRAAERILVDYEVLPAVTDMEQALSPDAPQVHGFGNVIRHIRIEHGEPDPRADVWVEGYYETGVQDQAPLGPESGLAIPAEDGGIDLFVATQWVHIDRRQLAPCLGLPEDKVRVHLAGVGGAFGAREDANIHIHACMLALHTGRPVKMSYGREESFLAHVHRHPSRIWARHGASGNGDLVAVRVRLLLDGGAYTSTSPAVLVVASTTAAGPYEVPNALIEGTAVYTNNPPSGAMRGFGAVQACFAYEAQMDKLARALGIDPIELRLRNALTRGSVMPTGQVIRGSAPVAEVITRCAALPPPEPARAPSAGLALPGSAGNVGRGEGLRRGIGFAVGFKNISYSAGADDYCEATVTLSPSAGGPLAEVRCAASEVGQGIHTLLAQIVRQELGVRDVAVHTPDTTMGSAGPSSASRLTVMAGGAVQMACEAVREQLLERARRRLGPARRDARLTLEDGAIVADGVPVGPIEEHLETSLSASRIHHHRRTEPLDARGQGDVHVAFGFAAHRAVVDVDEELGLVRVVHVGAVQDVGKVMSRPMLEGQVEGGIAQGLGLALLEELRVEGGRIANPSFTDYLLPTILDAPAVTARFIEEPEPGMPYGAKGAAEHPTIVSVAAVAAAVRDATGRELNRVPARMDELVGLAPPVSSGGVPPSPSVPGPLPIPEYAGLPSQRSVPLDDPG
jgi:xanthine dehydrogenase D subunit